MNILIADSGSTKTDWCVCHQGEILQRIQTQGINPVHQSDEEIEKIIREMAAHLSNAESIGRVHFYGAGCHSPKMLSVISNALQTALLHCRLQEIQVDSDLVGAAQALCQGEAGIACILGTGSNSCEFDGKLIQRNTPSLGYILGDEGSGASLGRILISDWLKGQLPTELKNEFIEEYHLSREEIIERVYRQPLANRFLASFAPFLGKHRANATVHHLLVEEFTRFFRRNVLTYNTTLPIHFIGSIAYNFKEELTEVAESLGLKVGQVLSAPMEGLVKYLSSNKEA